MSDIEDQAPVEVPFFLSMRQKVIILLTTYLIFAFSLSCVSFYRHYNATQLNTPTLGKNPKMEYLVLHREEFSNIPENWDLVENEASVVNASAGQLHLEIFPSLPSEVASAMIIEQPKDWLYVFMDARVKLEDNISPGSDEPTSGAIAFMGLSSYSRGQEPPRNELAFVIHPRESDSDQAGLLAISVVNQSRVYHKKVEVDVREWHNYTIQWAKDNATFLVDGITVAMTEKVPREMGLGFYAGIDNSCHQFRGEPQPGIDNPEDANYYFWNGFWEIPLHLNHTFSLILDHYEVTALNNSEIFTHLLEDAGQRILGAETAGVNATYLWEIHRESSHELKASGYLGSSSYIAMTAIREHLPDITNHLVSATEAITRARQTGRDRDLKIMQSQYQHAITHLIENQPEEAERYLDMIMTRG